MTYDGDDTRTMWFANWHSEEMYQFVKSESIHTEDTGIQRLEVIETELYGRVMLLNGEIQIATGSDAPVHEAMVHPAMLAHDDPANVLVIGGGDGGSTREALKHDPDHVDVVEIDERVVAVAKEYFPGFASGLTDDRVSVHHLDGRQFIREVDRTYDVVIMDISDPQGPAKTVFTTEFYTELVSAMRPDAVLHTHCESPDSSGNTFYRVIATLEEQFETVEPYRQWVPAYIDFWGRAFASDTYSARDLSIEAIERRFNSRSLDLAWLTPELFHAMFRSINKEVRTNLQREWEPLTEDSPPSFERP